MSKAKASKGDSRPVNTPRELRVFANSGDGERVLLSTVDVTGWPEKAIRRERGSLTSLFRDVEDTGAPVLTIESFLAELNTKYHLKDVQPERLAPAASAWNPPAHSPRTLRFYLREPDGSRTFAKAVDVSALSDRRVSHLINRWHDLVGGSGEYVDDSAVSGRCG